MMPNALFYRFLLLFTYCCVLPCKMLHASASERHDAEQDTVLKVTEFTPRKGLPHFFDQIQQGKKVKVAYLGGSITRADQGWRTQTYEYLQKQYPQAKFEQIMAAIGGTGSDFGAYRLYRHVLQYQPDLVFVEFAVNDQAKAYHQVVASMEGIVRQIWKYNPQIDICFVYTFQKVQLPLYQRNLFPVSVSAMETVANHYNIPSIFLGLSSINLIQAGKMKLQGAANSTSDTLVFSTDGVHPLAHTGHKFYAETVIRYLPELQATSKATRHKLKKPLVKDNLEHVAMIDLDKVEKSSAWLPADSVVIGKPFANLMPPVYGSADTSQFIKLKFKGGSFGIVDVLGPSSGQIVVWIDNEPPRYLNRFDEYCTYYRMNYTLITGLKPGKHTAIIKVSPQQLDKAAILQKRNNTIGNPLAFSKHAFYVGAFLVRQKRN